MPSRLHLDAMEYVVTPSIKTALAPATSTMLLEIRPPVNDSATETVLLRLFNKSTAHLNKEISVVA